MNLEFNFQQFQKDFEVENDLLITRVCQSNSIKNNSLLFNLKPDQSFYDSLEHYSDLIIFVPKASNIMTLNNPKVVILSVVNPRLSYILVARKYFKHFDFKSGFEENSRIHSSSKISKSAVIMPDVFIGPNCIINDNVFIGPGVKILSNTNINEDTVIGPNSVIGQPGFGVEKDNNKPLSLFPRGGIAYKMPHFGGVIIGSSCNIGALNTIASGAIEPTSIGDNVQTDDHVHIAHNCKIGKGVLIAAHAEISGSVQIEEDCWIGPNCSIMQKIIISRGSVIGIGAIVKKSVAPNSIISGIESKKLIKK